MNRSSPITTRKTISLFLAFILTTGTIASIFPSSSFMTASAQAVPDYGMDNNYEKSYGKDNSYQSQYPSSYKPNYKSEYQSYSEKDNYKSQKYSTIVKKIKCINPSVNINGDNSGDVNVGNTGQVAPTAAAAEWNWW